MLAWSRIQDPEVARAAMRIVPRWTSERGSPAGPNPRGVGPPARVPGASSAADDRRGPGTRARGQSLVEFSLVLAPLLLLLLAIVQFGFIFNSYVTLSNAAREGARTGTIYVYDRTVSKSANDLARNEAIRAAVLDSLNLLSRTAPQLSTSGTWTQSGTTFTNGDLTVSYTVPDGMTDADNRAGEQVTLHVTYHQDLIIPLIANLLPRDANGRLALGAEVTMVIN
jgi:Flp pilus assembly protein TadG